MGQPLWQLSAERIERANLTAFARMVATTPCTMHGKIAQLAVHAVIHGREVENVQALANPRSLARYRDREELRS